jgi:hypothetical protein
MDEVRRLEVYGGISPSPFGNTIPGTGSSQHPSQDSGYGRAAFGAGGSSALQALYATDAVKQAFVSLWYRDQPLPDSDDDDDDDWEDWEDEMDPVTFARSIAAQNQHLANIV